METCTGCGHPIGWWAKRHAQKRWGWHNRCFDAGQGGYNAGYADARQRAEARCREWHQRLPWAEPPRVHKPRTKRKAKK